MPLDDTYRNSVHNGDCLKVLRTLPSESIDLVYLDPPFNTRTPKQLRARYDDVVYSSEDDWGSAENYADWLRPRLEEMHRVLKPTGAIYFHCDWRMSHYVRFLLDQIFGDSNFRNEIIWYYKRWTAASNTLQRSHQNIYFYAKSKSHLINYLYDEYSSTTNVDQIFQNRTRDVRGKSAYSRNHEGSIDRSKSSKKGVLLRDVWEIPYLNPKAKERVSYPSQKPISLIERILQVSSSEGSIVLDPFCGSGTTPVACMLNNRLYIAIDANPEAISLTHQRLSQPRKSESALLKQGQAPFEQSIHKGNEDVVHFLSQIPHFVVRRNKAIDCILKDSFKEKSILLRLLGVNEELQGTLSKLQQAAKKRDTVGILVLPYFSSRVSDNLLDHQSDASQKSEMYRAGTNVLVVPAESDVPFRVVSAVRSLQRFF